MKKFVLDRIIDAGSNLDKEETEPTQDFMMEFMNLAGENAFEMAMLLKRASEIISQNKLNDSNERDEWLRDFVRFQKSSSN